MVDRLYPPLKPVNPGAPGCPSGPVSPFSPFGPGGPAECNTNMATDYNIIHKRCYAVIVAVFKSFNAFTLLFLYGIKCTEEEIKSQNSGLSLSCCCSFRHVSSAKKSTSDELKKSSLKFYFLVTEKQTNEQTFI